MALSKRASAFNETARKKPELFSYYQSIARLDPANRPKDKFTNALYYLAVNLGLNPTSANETALRNYFPKDKAHIYGVYFDDTWKVYIGGDYSDVQVNKVNGVARMLSTYKTDNTARYAFIYSERVGTWMRMAKKYGWSGGVGKYGGKAIDFLTSFTPWGTKLAKKVSAADRREMQKFAMAMDASLRKSRSFVKILQTANNGFASMQDYLKDEKKSLQAALRLKASGELNSLKAQTEHVRSAISGGSALKRLKLDIYLQMGSALQDKSLFTLYDILRQHGKAGVDTIMNSRKTIHEKIRDIRSKYFKTFVTIPGAKVRIKWDDENKTWVIKDPAQKQERAVGLLPKLIDELGSIKSVTEAQARFTTLRRYAEQNVEKEHQKTLNEDIPYKTTWVEVSNKHLAEKRGILFFKQNKDLAKWNFVRLSKNTAVGMGFHKANAKLNQATYYDGKKWQKITNAAFQQKLKDPSVANNFPGASRGVMQAVFGINAINVARATISPTDKAMAVQYIDRLKLPARQFQVDTKKLAASQKRIEQQYHTDLKNAKFPFIPLEKNVEQKLAQIKAAAIIEKIRKARTKESLVRVDGKKGTIKKAPSKKAATPKSKAQQKRVPASMSARYRQYIEQKFFASEASTAFDKTYKKYARPELAWYNPLRWGASIQGAFMGTKNFFEYGYKNMPTKTKRTLLWVGVVGGGAVALSLFSKMFGSPKQKKKNILKLMGENLGGMARKMRGFGRYVLKNRPLLYVVSALGLTKLLGINIRGAAASTQDALQKARRKAAALKKRVPTSLTGRIRRFGRKTLRRFGVNLPERVNGIQTGKQLRSRVIFKQGWKIPVGHTLVLPHQVKGNYRSAKEVAKPIAAGLYISRGRIGNYSKEYIYREVKKGPLKIASQKGTLGVTVPVGTILPPGTKLEKNS